MPRALIACIIFGLLTLTVPWWWIGREPDGGGGLPRWVLYTLAMNVVFAVAVAWMLQRFWKRFEDDDEDHPSAP